jgi:hypothetical protein
MNERPTPETDAMWEKWPNDRLPNGRFRYGPLDLADFARRLERQRDELLEALYAIEERFVDGCDTYDDWQFMGETARAAIAAVKGDHT